MTQIHVLGHDYDLVTMDELTLDEAIVVYEYTKLSLDQILNIEGGHPGVVAAMIHVAVARARPDENAASLRKTIGQIPVSDLDAIFADISEEDEQLPPPSGTGAATSAADPSDASGGGSSPSTATDPADIPAPGTGSRGSDTGAASDRLTSVG
jgi:hypothetical protein